MEDDVALWPLVGIHVGMHVGSPVGEHICACVHAQTHTDWNLKIVTP